MQNKTKAATALAISAIGAAGTLPGFSPLANLAVTQTGGFFLNLFNHGFIAATIGGLADWFAVTALFRKPLGIGYRTEILKRNRGRITDAIIDFVGQDLLNTENIMHTVKDENTAKLLIDYFEKNNGREKLKETFREIFSEVFADFDSKKFSKSVTPILENEFKNLDADKIVDAVLKAVTNEKHSRRILTMLLETGQKILKSEHIQDALSKKITELRETYEGDSAGRALVLSSLNLSDEKILSVLNENLENKISETIEILNIRGMVDNDKAAAAKNLLQSFGEFIKNSAGNLDIKSLYAELRRILAEKFNESSYIETWLNVNVKGEIDPEVLEKINRQNAANPQHSRVVKIEKQNPIWQPALDKIIDEKIDEFINSPIWQEKFDKLIKNFIKNLLEEYHGQIPDLIRERLDKLSDDDLTEFVEKKVSDDLQMIRINGSICGAVAGMFLYVVSQIIEKFLIG